MFQTLQKNNSSDVGLRTAEEQSEIDVLKAFVNELKINFGETFVADREKDVMDKVLLKKRISNSKMYLKIIKNSKRSKFEDFEFIAMLGRGAFGKVYLVERHEDKKVFAIKTVDKAEIIEGDDIDVTMAERRILALGNRKNFLTGLQSAFQVTERVRRFSLISLLCSDLQQTVLRDGVPVRWRPHVPHGEQSQRVPGARTGQAIRSGDRRGSDVSPPQQNCLQRPQAHQHSPGRGGTHQTGRLRPVQGEHQL